MKRLDKMAHSVSLAANKASRKADEFRKDARDYRHISKLIKEGKLSAAAKAIRNLDAAARNEIKLYVYEAVMEHEK